MTPPGPDDEAMLYALGALPAGRRMAVRRRRLVEPRLARELDRLEDQLVDLLLAAPPVEPPAGAWAGITAALDAAGPAGLLLTRAARVPWEAWSEGVEMKVLHRDPAGEPSAMLLRVAPGAPIAEHVHDRIEECLILTGDLDVAGQILGPGDFQVAYPGSSHARMTSPSGSLIYVRYLPA
jgi:quercetin dioxygenase-like cupin family protein